MTGGRLRGVVGSVPGRSEWASFCCWRVLPLICEKRTIREALRNTASSVRQGRPRLDHALENLMWPRRWSRLPEPLHEPNAVPIEASASFSSQKPTN